MIASLPMYWRDETAEAYRALWQAVRTRAGGDLPRHLTEDGAAEAHWQAPDLVLSQTCSLPFRRGLHRSVTLIGAVDAALPGCPPGYYRSVAVMRRGARPGPGLRLALNAPGSQSGWAAARDWETRSETGFASYLHTGAHRASAAAVAEGAADIAFIDAVSWRGITRWDSWAAALEVVDETPPTPGLPLITAAPGRAADLGRALAEAMAELPPAWHEITGWHGLVPLSAEAYLALPLPDDPPEK